MEERLAVSSAVSAGKTTATRAKAMRMIRENLTCYLFLLPYLLLFGAFVFVPFFWAIWLSFQEGGVMSPPVFVVHPASIGYNKGISDQGVPDANTSPCA